MIFKTMNLKKKKVSKRPTPLRKQSNEEGRKLTARLKSKFNAFISKIMPSHKDPTAISRRETAQSPNMSSYHPEGW